jgi:hypothetical protein
VHHSEQWNYDIPTAPILMYLTMNGRKIPALIQNTKQGLIFAFNRETGEPIWPIEERPVVQTEVPGNYTAPTQPYPTRPEPLDRIVLNGITDEFVMDWTPELKQRATEILGRFVGGLYMPPLLASPEQLHQQHQLRWRRHLSSAGRGSRQASCAPHAKAAPLRPTSCPQARTWNEACLAQGEEAWRGVNDTPHDRRP